VWRETRAAKTLVTLLVLAPLFSPALPDMLRCSRMIPVACADTKRKRLMQRLQKFGTIPRRCIAAHESFF
jgi:hypothetical protein